MESELGSVVLQAAISIEMETDRWVFSKHGHSLSKLFQ